MRQYINLIESILRPLDEIEIGGEVIGDHLEDIRKNDFKSKQLDLFPDIPTLEPNLPKDFEQMGRIGIYFVARSKDNDGRDGMDAEYTYYLFDKGHPFAYVSVIPPNASFGNGYSVVNPPLDGDGLRVVSVWVDRTHAGQNMAIQMYRWLLQHVCDYILPDDLQTQGGVAIWRKMLNSKLFDVMVYDYNTDSVRRRWAGKDFNQVYRTNHLRPYVTLRGRSEELLNR